MIQMIMTRVCDYCARIALQIADSNIANGRTRMREPGHYWLVFAI